MFTGTDAACNNAIYLLPPSFTYGQAIQFTIPRLFTGIGDYQTAQYSNADFQFQLISGQYGSPPAPTILASITITGTNAWACATTARTALMNNFTDFLQNIETNFELKGILVPGATFRIGQQLADWIPAPLMETLFYRYSLSPGFALGTTPYVDVRPGMTLRVEEQISQYLTATSPLNGYVSGGCFRYQVSSVSVSGKSAVTFDPFLGAVRTPTINPATSAPLIAGGVVDLQSVTPQKYWRLFYPQSIGAPKQPGDLTAENNVALISAQTLAQLNSATSTYSQGSTPNSSAIFLGRAIAVPEIPIWITVRTQSGVVQTILEYVPIGTTITNIIERFTLLPADLVLLPTVPSMQVQSAVTVARTTFATGNQAALSAPSIGNITWYTQTVPGVSAPILNVPLIAGDVVTVTV